MSSTAQAATIEQIRLAMTKTNGLFCDEVFGKRNYDALSEVYTANARLLPPGAPMISDGKGIRDFWSTFIESANAKSAVLASVEVTQAGDDAVEIGKATLTMVPEGQTLTTVEVKYVVHWKQEDGQWKWNIDIWNTNS